MRSAACPSPYVRRGSQRGRLPLDGRARRGGCAAGRRRPGGWRPAERLDPLRRLAQRDAGRAEEEGLLLHAAGVGEDGARLALAGAASRGRAGAAGRARAPPGRRPRRVQPLRACAGGAGSTADGAAPPAPQRCARSRVAGRPRSPAGARWPGSTRRGASAVGADGAVCARPRPGSATTASVITSPTRWTPRAMPSRAQVRDRGRRRAEEEVETWSVSRRLISSGIARVEAAQPRLDVGHRQPELGRGQGAGQRRVRVAETITTSGRCLDEHRLERLQHAAGHARRGCRSRRRGARSGAGRPSSRKKTSDISSS